MKKILIIEDDLVVAHIYKVRLQKAGYEVELAEEGQAGFYKMHECRPDAVLLDLMLPKMGGVDILKKLRAQKQFADTPILVLTNAYVPNMVMDATRAGATCVFNKATLKPAELIDRLERAMGVKWDNLPVEAPVQAASPPPPASAPPPAEEPCVAPPRMTRAQFLARAPYHDAPLEPPRSERIVFSPAPPALAPAIPPSPSALPPPPPRADHTTPALRILPAPAHDEAAENRAEVLQTFQDSGTPAIALLQKAVQELARTQDAAARHAAFEDLSKHVHFFSGGASMAGYHSLATLASALEALLRELLGRPQTINDSTVRTVAAAVDLTAGLFAMGPQEDVISRPKPIVMAADDEQLCRLALAYALEKAGLGATVLEHPRAALEAAQQTAFDLIILDVEMDGMSGFDLCQQIRTLPKHQTTPIIFVTGLNDLASRARSTQCGGNDFIAKPFPFIELGVKALTYVVRQRLAVLSPAPAARCFA